MNQPSDLPRPAEPFGDPAAGQIWGDFRTAAIERNQDQAPVDMSKPNSVWHYLGRHSTPARPQYTEDVQNPRHNPASSFLDHVNAANAPVAASQRPSSRASSSTRGRKGSEEPYQYRSRLTGLGKFDLQLQQLQLGGRQQSPKFESGSSTSPPMSGTGQQHRSGIAQMSGDPGQASPVTGSNHLQQPPSQSSPVTGASYFQQTAQTNMMQASPVSGSSYFQTPQRSSQSGTPVTGSNHFQQPQESDIQQGSAVSSSSYFQQPLQGNTQQAPFDTGTNYFQQQPQRNIQQPSSAHGSNYFQQTPQRATQQGSPAMGSNYFQQPQQSITQQRAGVPGSNYFQQPAQRNTQQPSFSQQRAPVASMSSGQDMENIDPTLQNVVAQPQHRASPANLQTYHQAQRQVQQDGVPQQQQLRRYAPVANMGYSQPQQQQEPHDPLSSFPYLQRCRAKCSTGPYQSPYAPQGGFTEPYLPLRLNRQHQQPQQEQAPLQQSEQDQNATEQGQIGQTGMTEVTEVTGVTGLAEQIGQAGQEEEEEPRGEKRDYASFWEDMRGATNDGNSSDDASGERLANMLLTHLAQEGLASGAGGVSGIGGAGFEGQEQGQG